MTPAGPWEAFIGEHFPGYLLPQAASHALSEEAAALFLKRVSGDPRALFLLRALSAITGHADELRAFALQEMPLLARRLPPRTEAESRVWEGSFQGRIDAQATLKQRLEGKPLRLVTRAPRLRLDRLETVLLKSVTARLVVVLAVLRTSGLLAHTGWSEGLEACEAVLHDLLSTSPLRDIPSSPVTPIHELAARGARDPGYTLAADLYRALHDALDVDDPEVLAQVIAKGALLPLQDFVRFELAVLVRLLQALWQRLEERAPGRWTFHRTLVLPDRAEVADFEDRDGGRVRVFYNQAWLPPGPHDRGLRRYFGRHGRLRPDITVVASAPGIAARAAVVEAKLSSDPEYLAQGFRQAILYRHEYASELVAWPKAVLVTSTPLRDAPAPEEDVIAVGWDQWVPEDILDGWLEGLL